jgi:MFS family permease
MFSSTIQLMIILGQLVATCVTYGTKNIEGNAGWRIPIGLQLLLPTVLFMLLPFVPESPRWLLSRDRREDCAKNLRKLRKYASEENIQIEIESLAYAHANEHKGSWTQVFDKSNRVSVSVRLEANRSVTCQTRHPANTTCTRFEPPWLSWLCSANK